MAQNRYLVARKKGWSGQAGRPPLLVMPFARANRETRNARCRSSGETICITANGVFA